MEAPMDTLLSYKLLTMLLLLANSAIIKKMTDLDKSKYKSIFNNVIVLAFAYLCIISLIYNDTLNIAISPKHIISVFIISLILPIFIYKLLAIDNFSKFTYKLSIILINHFGITFIIPLICFIIGLFLNLNFLKNYFLTIAISFFILNYIIVVIREKSSID